MKIDEKIIEQFKKEDGTIDIDKLNEQVQNSINGIVAKKEAKFKEKEEELLKSLKAKEESKPKDKDKDNPIENEDVLKIKNEMEELKKSLRETSEQKKVSEFKSKAKSNNMTDEQIENLLNISAIDKLDDFDFSNFKRTPVENTGNENTKKEIDEETKKSMLDNINFW